MDRKSFILINSQKKLTLAYNYYKTNLDLNFSTKEINTKFNNYIKSLNLTTNILKNELDYYYDLCVESFDYMRDFIIILIVRLERFLQEFQLLNGVNITNLKTMNEFLEELKTQTELNLEIETIQKYIDINNLSKHGYGKALIKIINNNFKLSYQIKKIDITEYSKSDDKRIVNIDQSDIDELYRLINKIFDHLINQIKSA